jgi:hypothetical protein
LGFNNGEVCKNLMKKPDENECNSDQGRPIEKSIGPLNSPWIGERDGPKFFKDFFFFEIGEVWKKFSKKL